MVKNFKDPDPTLVMGFIELLFPLAFDERAVEEAVAEALISLALRTPPEGDSQGNDDIIPETIR